MSVDDDIYATVTRRRRLVADALSCHLDPTEPDSTAARFQHLLNQPHTMIVSADIDGLVTAAMLASVAPDWRIGAFLRSSAEILAPPSMTSLPSDAFGVDVFSTQMDCITNHPVLYGRKQTRDTTLRAALWGWDDAVQAAATSRTFVAPSLWTGTTAGWEDADKIHSAKYKYPLGSAQITLALLEAIGRPPKFYDRTLLPWLVANCDGGADSHRNHAYNTSVWWPALAAIVGPGSLTDRIFEGVDSMRPHDLRHAINGLTRERAAQGQSRVLRDDWSLAGTSAAQLQDALGWLADLSVWPDPVRGGLSSITTWTSRAVSGSGLVYIDKAPPTRKGPPPIAEINAKADPKLAAASIKSAEDALNANFYTGGVTGSRFNWVGGW